MVEVQFVQPMSYVDKSISQVDWQQRLVYM